MRQNHYRVFVDGKLTSWARSANEAAEACRRAFATVVDDLSVIPATEQIVQTLLAQGTTLVSAVSPRIVVVHDCIGCG